MQQWEYCRLAVIGNKGNLEYLERSGRIGRYGVDRWLAAEAAPKGYAAKSACAG